jgi:hypothetical protein
VVQIFSSVNISITHLRLQPAPQDGTLAEVLVRFNGPARMCDLICRKLRRLIDALEVEVLPPLPATDDWETVPGRLAVVQSPSASGI